MGFLEFSLEFIYDSCNASQIYCSAEERHTQKLKLAGSEDCRVCLAVPSAFLP